MDLFIEGEIPKDYIGVAIVGSRNASTRGKEITHDFSFELAKNGITIISGLARGIDTVAHKAAIEAGGKTIAVLGSGLDIIYPSENKQLAKTIVNGYGAVVSPYPYGTKPLSINFKPRNEIVVQLSKVVLVVEGQRQSGTINTAHWAADMGKEVFCIPGSPATDYLISSGCSVANSPHDILSYLESN